MPASLAHVFSDIESQIKSSRKLVAKVRRMRMPQIQVELVAELAFLRVFIAWENFLEQSFLRYLVGARSRSGQAPTKYVNPKNLDHARQVVCSGREYFQWNSASKVVQIAETYFRDGEPFKPILEGISAELKDMATIRNRIAHRSTSARDRFNSLVRKNFGHGKPGMTPGRFLLTSTTPSSQSSFFDDYTQTISAASFLIVD